ncbi:aminopeptidase P family protein [Mesorhizobium sp. Z1-4]|uniref:aminopeptidase P family protein n=1 Tax=Mesorhizobium sp. Z1-4 TaxID=2448478 RepID=UPI000FDA22D7|nr:aminopeptidase P family protein [Mesorhizobium sp. Z1-4]
MFQEFDSVANPAQGPARVTLLREKLAELDLDGFLIPRADEHQGEYVAPRSERLQWMTGFTGSAGAALILRSSAHLFVDGRYTLQARQQSDPATFTVEDLVAAPPSKWLAENTAKGWKIGIDPWLHTISETRALRQALEGKGGSLAVLDANPVDLIWEDQPQPPLGAVTVHPLAFSGEEAAAKLARINAAVSDAGARYVVLTDPASLAWAFNIRGSDIAHTPVPLGFAILDTNGRASVYADARKFDGESRAHLEPLADLRPPNALEDDLRRLSASGTMVALDPALAAEKLRIVVEQAGGRVVPMPDPARLPRATKNSAELDGARAAHRRDGAAVARFLCWLDAQQAGTVDEIGAATQLEAARRRLGDETQMPLRDISFDTISGAGPNGAVIHYRVTRRTNRTLGTGELYLVDSGGQFQDGTTDITRTVAIGAPSAEMRRHYTLVLKGLIGLSLLRYPAGTRGADIDAIARAALWKAGLDYAHGTGHGVGSFLSVHEGPQRIAKTGTEKLLPGMILSNEPGFYKEGAYGIRLENLIVVTPAQEIAGGETPMHGFETLTLAPFDRRLIDTSVLSEEECDWLDAYHSRVLAEIGPMVDGQTLRWLENATAELAR